MVQFVFDAHSLRRELRARAPHDRVSKLIDETLVERVASVFDCRLAAQDDPVAVACNPAIEEEKNRGNEPKSGAFPGFFV